MQTDNKKIAIYLQIKKQNSEESRANRTHQIIEEFVKVERQNPFIEMDYTSVSVSAQTINAIVDFDKYQEALDKCALIGIFVGKVKDMQIISVSDHREIACDNFEMPRVRNSKTEGLAWDTPGMQAPRKLTSEYEDNTSAPRILTSEHENK